MVRRDAGDSARMQMVRRVADTEKELVVVPPALLFQTRLYSASPSAMYLDDEAERQASLIDCTFGTML